jgi:ferrous iron transport protein A
VRKIMSLTSVNQGREVTLIDIQGGRGLRSKLYSMGLFPGVKLKVVGNGGGPIMIAVNDTRLALGFGMARKIMVE